MLACRRSRIHQIEKHEHRRGTFSVSCPGKGTAAPRHPMPEPILDPRGKPVRIGCNKPEGFGCHLRPIQAGVYPDVPQRPKKPLHMILEPIGFPVETGRDLVDAVSPHETAIEWRNTRVHLLQDFTIQIDQRFVAH